jgi:EAL domain-containing protein (putative c-di-GMP-specific phosphodiesterase class I)
MAASVESLHDVLRFGGLRSVYQPIVDLDGGGVVGFEALIRGPAGSGLERPDQLFAAAKQAELVNELDWECRATALQGALDFGLGTSIPLFINVEPAALSTPRPSRMDAVFEAAQERLNVFVEFTERSLLADPALVLTSLARVRSLGFGVALDDVGADPASLALLPFMEPDVIKLDLHLVQQHADREIAAIVTAVRADVERRGALTLAEGIETDVHLDRARVCGATLGQGWMFGRPAPLQRVERVAATHIGHTCATSTPLTPWELVADWPTRRTTSKELLIPMSHHLEQYGLGQTEPTVLISAFQHGRHFTRATAARYGRMVGSCTLIGAVARDLDITVPGVIQGGIAAGHPLEREWTVTVVGPHYAGALIARERPGQGLDSDQIFDYVITHDRAVVTAAARSLMQYLQPS